MRLVKDTWMNFRQKKEHYSIKNAKKAQKGLEKQQTG